MSSVTVETNILIRITLTRKVVIAVTVILSLHPKHVTRVDRFGRKTFALKCRISVDTPMHLCTSACLGEMGHDDCRPGGWTASYAHFTDTVVCSFIILYFIHTFTRTLYYYMNAVELRRIRIVCVCVCVYVTIFSSHGWRCRWQHSALTLPGGAMPLAELSRAYYTYIYYRYTHYIMLLCVHFYPRARSSSDLVSGAHTRSSVYENHASKLSSSM